MKWEVLLTYDAKSDKIALRKLGLGQRVEDMLYQMSIDPYYLPPPYIDLVHPFDGCSARKIDSDKSIIYQTHDGLRRVVVYKMG